MVEHRPDRVLGTPHDEFWTWCARGELRLQRCERCGEFCWPADEACDNCAATALAWERMSGNGIVISWCNFERDYYAGVFPLPWTTILVALEEGPFFISNPADFGAEDIALGMRVEVDFLSCMDSKGSFALPVFRRAQSHPAMGPET